MTVTDAVFLGMWYIFNLLFSAKNWEQDAVVMGRDGERGQVKHKYNKKIKTEYLHYWEDIIDLVPRADIFSNQGLSQVFSLDGPEMVGSSA